MARQRMLCPRICFALRKDHGSWAAAARAIAAKGIRSPITGRPFTRVAVFSAGRQAPGFAAWARRTERQIEKMTRRMGR